MPPEPPAPIVPMPASLFGSLRGRRVMVGVPGLGFRGDLRADDPIVQGSRTYVPVLTEQDYYRAETEQTEVFAALVPLDRVWVEDVAGNAVTAPAGQRTLDAPRRREAVPASLATRVLGNRIIQAVPDGHVRDLRACTDAYPGSDGTDRIRVCGEADWYRWALLGTTPDTSDVPVNLLWIE